MFKKCIVLLCLLAVCSSTLLGHLFGHGRYPGFWNGFFPTPPPPATAGLASYQPGSAGYQPGYQPGFSAGLQPGFSAGYQPGFTAGYQPGFIAGYQPGFSAGYQPGFAAYQPGYQPGFIGYPTSGSVPGAGFQNYYYYTYPTIEIPSETKE